MNWRSTIIFLFGEDFEPAPSFDNIKCHYISRELKNRGVRVKWLKVTSNPVVTSKESMTAKLSFIKLGKWKFLSKFILLFRLVSYCLSNGVDLIYLDEWLYYRHSPSFRFLTIVALRLARVGSVIDRRDPYLDFQIADGKITGRELKGILIRLQERIMIRLSKLTILSSVTYMKLLEEEGYPSDKLLGVFRGVDTNRFNPTADGSLVRSNLKLENKFVIGWFGMMLRYRLIDEVLVPLIKVAPSIWPDIQFLIGGKGPYESSFTKLLQPGYSYPISFVGLIPYHELPNYIAACDLTLCPVSTSSRHSLHTNSLKIIESLAVGKPVVAAKTRSSEIDMKNLKGVIWTGQTLNDFVRSIHEARKNFAQLTASAKYQSEQIADYSIASTIPVIVNAILERIR